MADIDAKAKDLAELAEVAGRSWMVGDAISEGRAALFDKCSVLILSQAETIAELRREIERLTPLAAAYDYLEAPALARAAKEGQDAPEA